jgi:hypothetical protein
MDQVPTVDSKVDVNSPPKYRKIWSLIESAGAVDEESGTRLMILRANNKDREMSLNQKSHIDKQSRKEWKLLIERSMKRSVNMSLSQTSNMKIRKVAPQQKDPLIKPRMTDQIQMRSRLRRGNQDLPIHKKRQKVKHTK